MIHRSMKVLIPFLILLVGAGAFYVLSQYNSRSLSLDISAPDEVMIGVPFDLKVGFSNQSGATLTNAVLTVNLPDGMVFVGSAEDKLIENKDIGNIGEGSLISETYKLVSLNGENSSKKIKAVLNYSPSSLGARFEKTGEKEISIHGSGVSVDLVMPQKVFNGEEFEFDVVYKNVTETDFSDLEFKIDYPPSFAYTSSTLKPDKNKDTWLLGDLNKGSEGDFSVKGSIVGPENSVFVFKAGLKMALEGRVYNLIVKEQSLAISPSPLSLGISLNGEQGYVSKLGDDLEYVLSYVNNTDVALRDIVIRAQLVGELFDLNTLETNAVLRSSDNTLIWSSNNASELNFLSPHSAGFVKFKIKTKEDFSVRRFGDKNFTLKVNAEIESPTIPSFVTASKTSNVARLETKVAGNLSIQSAGYFRDAKSGILNKGVMPLRVGKPTNFTVHWILKSAASDISNVEVRATLAEGVKFTDVAKSEFGSSPLYDEKTNQMVWLVNKVPANKGVVDSPAEAIFQIEATPLASQVGRYMALLSETSFKAVDDFTSLEITGFAEPLESSLPDDSTIGAQGGVVQP